MVECWNIGILGFDKETKIFVFPHYSIFPMFHYSNVLSILSSFHYSAISSLRCSIIPDFCVSAQNC
jgi:hypothetical protein